MIRRVILGLLVVFGIGAHTSDFAGPLFVPFFTAADWAIKEVLSEPNLGKGSYPEALAIRTGIAGRFSFPKTL